MIGVTIEGILIRFSDLFDESISSNIRMKWHYREGAL